MSKLSDLFLSSGLIDSSEVIIKNWYNSQQILFSKIEELYKKRGYSINKFNLIGIRNATGDKLNEWNDLIGYWGNFLPEVNRCVFFPATTDPGKYYVNTPMTSKGAAILIPGQYSCWIFGKHKGQYTALVQHGGSVTVARDYNKDGSPDGDATESGFFGINLHHGFDSAYVDKHGAGCQVLQNTDEFIFLLSMIKKFAKPKKIKGEDVYTYTLISIDELLNI